MPIDRSKYRAATLQTVQSATKEAKKYDTYYGGGKGEYAPFWKNRDGITIKRVLPAHEPGDSPYVPMLTAKLDCEVEKKDENGDVIGKEVKQKKIFIATLHGKMPFDIIDEYIKRVYELAEQIQDKDDRQKFLNPITGYKMGGKWVWGIRPQREYIYYALIEGKIYRDSLKPKQMEALNKESADLCEQNDTVAIDVFSDPENGFPIQYDRGKDEKGKTVETLKSLPLKRSQGWDDYFAEHAVTDKVLEELETYPSLKKLYVDCYSKRDFDLALDGLKRFDEANPSYNIFAQEDFLDKVEEMSNLVEKIDSKGIKEGDDDLPFGDDEEKPVETAKKVSVKATPRGKGLPSKKKSEPTPEEKLAIVNKEFIEQYGEGYEELDLEGDELEEAYQLSLKHEDLGYDIPHVDGWGEEEDPTSEEDPEPEVEPEAEALKPRVGKPKGVNPPEDANSSSGMSAVERIRALRQKREKK